jgi:hypothetical protein
MIKKTFSNWSDIFCKNSEYSEERGLPMSPARTSTGATRGMNLGIFLRNSKCKSEKYCIFIFLFFDFLITIFTKKIIASKKWILPFIQKRQGTNSPPIERLC